MKKDRNRVCPVEAAGSLDTKLRKLFQNPRKILGPYVKEGMSVLDMGCGPGFFSVELAPMVGKTGKVFAADLQEGMLNKVKEKIRGTELEEIIRLHKTDKDKINLQEKVDFILAFYMVHEVPDKKKLFKEMKSLLNPNGTILMAEPPLHVSKKDFNSTLEFAESIGFNVEQGSKLSMGKYAVLHLNGK